MKEASARIKIHKLLENAGWRFFANTNGQVREINSRRFTRIYTTSSFTTADLKAVLLKYRKLIPDHVKDDGSLNQFVA